MATTFTTTDSKQETMLAQGRAQAAGTTDVCVTFSFVRVKVEQTFSSALKIQRGTLQLVTAEVNSDGYIQAQLKL